MALRAKLDKAVARACPAWAAAQRDDLVQAAMVRVILVRDAREATDPLPASYLWKVGYAATIDELRRLRAMREVARDAEEDAVAVGVRDCIGSLADPQRQAVTLYLVGHTVSDCARLLGCAHKRAQTLVDRGLAQLRACLAKRGLTP